MPRLRSITDTSYFPVEDLDQAGTDDTSGADANDSSKDLAFLGCALSPGSSTFRVELIVHSDIPSSASPSLMERSLFITDLARPAAGLRRQRVLIVASHTHFLDSTIIPEPSLLAGFIVEVN